MAVCGPDRRARCKRFDESGHKRRGRRAASRGYKTLPLADRSIQVLCSALRCAAELCTGNASPFPFISVAFLPLCVPCLRSRARQHHGEPPNDWFVGVGVGVAAAAGAVLVPGSRGGAEVQCAVQLRRLDHGHRQPVHQRQAVADHLHAAALRRDLLRHPHLPLLRRPRHRRLSLHQVRAAVPAAVQVEQRGLHEGGEHGDHGGDGHGRRLLPVAGALRQDLEQRAHQLSNPVVPADHHLRLRTELHELPGQLSVRVRRVGGERLQCHALRRLQRRPGQHLHAQHRQHHLQRHREIDCAGGGGHRGAGRAADRVLPHLPDHLRDVQQRRLRQPRLPQEVQRPLHVPQQPPPDQDHQPPEQVQVSAHHVRRLLPGRLRHGPEPPELRFQHGVPDVLRVGRWQVQLRQQRAVRDAGRGGVRQPGGAPQLGRHPPHRGRVQADHRRLAQRALLPPGHPPQLGRHRHRQAVMGIH